MRFPSHLSPQVRSNPAHRAGGFDARANEPIGSLRRSYSDRGEDRSAFPKARGAAVAAESEEAVVMDTRGYSGYRSRDSGSNIGYDYGHGYSQGDPGTTANYGYDSYESYNSSLNDHDLYRSGYSYSEAGHDQDMTAYDGRYDSSYGNSGDQFQNTAWDNYGQQGQNWARGRRNNKRSMASSYSGYMGGEWNKPLQSKRGRGRGASGSAQPSSSHNIVPERLQGTRNLTAVFKQRAQKNWKMWDKNQPYLRRRGKKKTTNTTDEPFSKQAKTVSANSESEDEEQEGGAAEKSTKAEGVGEEKETEESGSVLTVLEEVSQVIEKLQVEKKRTQNQRRRRMQFSCPFCKYNTFYEDKMMNHMDSRFHKDHFKHIGKQFPQQIAGFLQEYIANRNKKTEERRETFGDVNAAILQIIKDEDHIADLPLEYFVKKVEAAHCTACNLFIPIQQVALDKHFRSSTHHNNSKVMMEKSKKSALMVARNILHQSFSNKLVKYLKGESPFAEGDVGTAEETAEGEDESKIEGKTGATKEQMGSDAAEEGVQGREEALTEEGEEMLEGIEGQAMEEDEEEPTE
ncbi:A-kinase anchor protein 8-like isoform X2 [Rhinatrema bivittatum]|uniref:A-kinase anchor protein 8-like isoform X2 n=1 Tax=Rhinatrema bivittatum TaxID=194408 RepID=UPI00112D1F04|nr:A-kinase anchor protein 8-like isoform X2 [Rhinatrema bivittatum]